MRRAVIASLCILSAAPAYAMAPAYLHCTGQDRAGKPTEHTIVVYSKSVLVDGLKHDLGSNASEYAILEESVDSALFGGPLTLISINRVTGEYTMSKGAGDNSLQESGSCVKVRRQL